KAVAVLFRYPERADGEQGTARVPAVTVPAAPVRRGPARAVRTPVRLAFVGAGNYASSMLLPHLAAREGVELST
ncbi:oxidoreductase, partial [Streptomyces sp. SID6648]|nr:oxidoreductase [Streptomyces sp. SID6648]